MAMHIQYPVLTVPKTPVNPTLKVVDLEKETLENDNFRVVVDTLPGEVQLVMMSIVDEIPREIHPHITQFLRVEGGRIRLTVGATPSADEQRDKVYILEQGQSVSVPKNVFHRIENISDENMPAKIYTLYFPPNHPADRIDRVRPADD